MNRVIQILFFFIIPFFSNAQVNKDSLLDIWNDKSLVDSVRLNAVGSLAWELLFSQPDSSYKYAQLQYEYANNVSDKKHLGKSLKTQGAFYYLKGNYKKALENYFASILTFKEIDDKEGVAANMSNIGIIYRHQGKLSKAIDYFKSSLRIQEEINDKVRMVNTQNNIGTTYQMQGDIDKAMEYFKLSKSTYIELGNEYGLASVLNNIAQIYQFKKEYLKSLEIYNKSLKIREGINDKQGQAQTLNNIGLLYKIQGNNELAMNLYKKSLLISESVNDKMVLAFTLNNIGTIFLEELKYNDALDYSLRALMISKELGSITVIKNASSNLYKIYKTIGDYSNALKMHELYLQMRDSVLNKESMQSLAEFKYEKEHQEQQDHIELLERQTEIDQLKQQQKENQLYFIIALLITVIGLGFLIYMINKKVLKEKRNLHQQKALLQTVVQTQEKERKRISKELHDGIGQMLTAVKMELESIKVNINSHKKKGDFSELHNDFLKSQKSVDVICNEVRNISHRMLPKALEIAGIVPALEELLINFLNGTSINHEFNHYGIKESRFPENIELAIYRIVQEMLNNIVKHADASFITLQLLKNNNKLILIVEDNGKGFNFDRVLNKHKGAGLSNINSRVQFINGKLSFESGIDKGTIATIRIPMDGEN